jgi:FkbM family methyltransferase
MPNKINKKIKVLAILLFLFASGAAVGWIGILAGKEWGKLTLLNVMTFENQDYRYPTSWAMLPRYKRLLFSIQTYHSSAGQDRWIAAIIFPNVRNGFYVDVGSGDGVITSNTKVLDDRGWKGICIDPFPTGMESRTAQLFREVVDSERGRKVRFKKAGFVGGIDSYLGRHAGSVKDVGSVEMTTTTLDEILLRAKAPSYIQYMSIDVEGAELEALKGLSFSKYKVGAFTIEHNWEESKRAQIKEFLESKGYRRVLSLLTDDFYLNNELLNHTLLQD